MEGKKRLAIREDEINYDDQVEIEKIDKIFALIRNTREARDRLLSRRCKLRKLAEEEDEKVEDKEKFNWIPSFKWEDFMNDNRRKSSTLFGSSSTKKNGDREGVVDDEFRVHDRRIKEEREVVGLIDLNLAL